MVSEAASSGRHAVVFPLEKKRDSRKHDYFITRLAGLNYITRTPVDKIYQVVLDLSKKDMPVKKLNDAEKMYEKLYRII